MPEKQPVRADKTKYTNRISTQARSGETVILQGKGAKPLLAKAGEAPVKEEPKP